MMRNIWLAGTAALAIASATQTAHAALSLSGANRTLGSIPGAEVPNDALAEIGFGTPLAGYYAAQVFTTQPGTLTFELLGWEASRTNTFRFTGSPGGSLSSRDGTSGWSTPLASAISSFSREIGIGLVPFEFETTFNLNGNNNEPAARGIVANGSNPRENDPPAAGNNPVVNFFASFGAPRPGNPGATDTTGNVLYLFFDDRGASRLDPRTPNPTDLMNDDDNHDDLVVRVTFIPVPEPATLGLLGAGLLGLGFAARRRRNV